MNKALQFILYFHPAFSVVANVMWNKGTLPDYASLCPFSAFCTTSPLKNITQSNQESCCQKCSCDSDCHMVGDCCPDVQHNIEDSVPRYQCVQPQKLIDIDRRFKYPPIIYYGDRYRIIDNCPDTNSSRKFQKCDRPEKIEDYVVVSDALNERVFKNRHCALCHGVEDVIEWKLKTYCTEIWTQTFKSFDERDEYILENCQLRVISPEPSIGDAFLCYEGVISECNYTKQWDVFDKAVEEACLKERPFQNTYFKRHNELFRREYTIYSNVYCYICNIKNSQLHELPEDTCDVPQSGGDVKGLKPVSFSALIEQVHDNKIDQTGRCESPEIWDKYTGVCRPFHCPGGTVPLNGRCEYATQSLEGVNFNLFFYVHLRQGNWTLLQENAYIMENIIAKKIGQPVECGLCWPEFLHSQNKSMIIYKHSFYTTENCSLVSRMKQFKLFITGGRTVTKFNFKSERFELVLDIALENDIDMTRLTFDARLGSPCGYPLQVDINAFMLHDCPRFQMSVEDLYDIGFDNDVIETSKDLTVVVDKAVNLASVCVVKYFQLRKSLGQSLRTNNHIIAASILLCVILFQRTI